MLKPTMGIHPSAFHFALSILHSPPWLAPSQVLLARKARDEDPEVFRRLQAVIQVGGESCREQMVLPTSVAQKKQKPARVNETKTLQGTSHPLSIRPVCTPHALYQYSQIVASE